MSEQLVKAEKEVLERQAIVAKAIEKVNLLQQELNVKSTEMARRKNLLESMTDLIQIANMLKERSESALNEMTKVEGESQKFALTMDLLLKSLINVGDLINKMASDIIRKKAMNPLISDELVATINTAAKDADNAVALTEITCKSAHTAHTTNTESVAAATLENGKAASLLKMINHISPEADTLKVLENKYQQSKQEYINSEASNREAVQQLNMETTSLNTAQVTLDSLQSALAAMKATKGL